MAYKHCWSRGAITCPLESTEHCHYLRIFSTAPWTPRHHLMHWQGATEAPRAVGFHLRPFSDPQTELKSEFIYPDSLSRIFSLLGFLEAIFPGTGSPGRQGIWVLGPGSWEYWEKSFFFFFWQNTVRMWASCLSCLSFEYLVKYLHIEVTQYIHVGKQMNQFDDWLERIGTVLGSSCLLIFSLMLIFSGTNRFICCV